MSETKNKLSIRKVYEVILEQNLETFGIHEVNQSLEQEHGPVKIWNNLDEVTEETDCPR